MDPLYDQHTPLQSVRQKGRPALTPNEIDEAADAGAVEQWADRERAIDELIDRSRDPERVAEALEGGKAPGKGRGGPRLSEEERLAREQAALDQSIESQYEGSEAPEWMQKGAETGAIEREWAEALEWIRRVFGGD